MQHPVVTLVTARNSPNLVGILLGSILIDSDHVGTYPTISRECYIFVTLWRHTCYTCYSDLKLGTGVGVTHIHHINIIPSLFVRYKAKKAVFTRWFQFVHILFTLVPIWFQIRGNINSLRMFNAGVRVTTPFMPVQFLVSLSNILSTKHMLNNYNIVHEVITVT